MRTDEALKAWGFEQLAPLQEGLTTFYESRGETPQRIDPSTVKVEVTLREELLCEDGHSAKECPEAMPATAVLRISAVTEDGKQPVMRDSDYHEWTLEDLLNTVAAHAGGELSFP